MGNILRITPFGRPWANCAEFSSAERRAVVVPDGRIPVAQHRSSQFLPED
jgi:hypothetical protein